MKKELKELEKNVWSFNISKHHFKLDRKGMRYKRINKTKKWTCVWKKQPEGNIIQDVRNLFKLKKKKVLEKRIITDSRNLFESEDGKGNYWKPIKVGNFCNNSYIKYKSNGDRIKN